MTSVLQSAAHAPSRVVLAVLVVVLGIGFMTPVAHANITDGTGGASARQLGIAPELLPPDMGQTALAVLVPETGHTVSGTMLDYWRANGAASVYGNPISEPYLAPNGYYSQAFERGIFQFLPEVIWTDEPTVRLQPTGAAELAPHRDETRADGRRVAGDRRVSKTVPASGNETRASEVYADGGRFSTETGFSISGQFGAWYDSHEGWFYLGAPISEPFRQRGVMVQLFRNGMLMEQEGIVRPASLPAENPARYGVDQLAPVTADLPVYDESLFVQVFNPYGIDTTGLPGRRSIVIDISEQKLTAYQGNQVILETLVSTGLAPNETEIGAFHVRMKFPAQDMAGFTDSSGEVISVGSAEGEGRGESYSVEDVPNVLYINYDAEALHGAYWHNKFGQRMSHGCINLPLDVAAFIYQWAPLGTAVTVIE
ncbi:MAG TPA: L,D-transpeptidase [Thermomicrobiales bacterium]|nr:L,D-transpeptidase [Thermomicrobiales bacterium]